VLLSETAAADPTRERADYEIILVTYRSRSLVEDLFRTLPDSVPVVVVDNSHGVDGLADFVSERKNARYLDGPGRGFASGANLGARTSDYEFIVFVNPDSSPTVEQLDTLVRDVERDATLGAAAALTVGPSGEADSGAGGWEPRAWRALVHAVGLHKIFPSAGLFARPAVGRPVELDWLSGAVMATRRQTFCDLGGFDESFFVYCDDVSFGRQCREAGLHQKLRTDVPVLHTGAGSGESRTTMLRLRGAAIIKYTRRHNSSLGVNGLRLALTAGYLARVPLCLLRGQPVTAREHLAFVHGMWFGPPDMPA
jgi:N-acetylglucosaminyl-diphospho-decaprenol L-rhamnosyltransferase